MTSPIQASRPSALAGRVVAWLALALAWLVGCERTVEPYDPGILRADLPEVVEALAAGAPERALAALEQRRAAGTAPEGAGHFEAVALVDAGRLGEAVPVLEAELAARPGNGLAHLLLCEALTGLGRVEQAAPHLATARALLPGTPYVELVAGRLALNRSQDVEAARAFLTYLQADRSSPRAAEAHHSLAQIAARKGNPQAAEEAAALSEKIQRAHQYLNAFRQRLRENPGDGEAALGAGMVWLDLYREVDPDPVLLTRSRDALVACLERTPTEVRALFNLGLVVLLMGEPEQAQDAWDRALELAPDHPGVLLNQGALAREQGQTDRAEDLLARALARATGLDDGIRARVELGRCREARGDLQGALVLYRKALALDPTSPRVAGLAQRLEASSGDG